LNEAGLSTRASGAHINDARNLRSGSLVGSPLVPRLGTDPGFIAALVQTEFRNPVECAGLMRR
jgi:hypothetical protein